MTNKVIMLTAEVKALGDENESLRAKVAELREYITERERYITELVAEIIKLRDKVAELEAENELIYQANKDCMSVASEQQAILRAKVKELEGDLQAMTECAKGHDAARTKYQIEAEELHSKVAELEAHQEKMSKLATPSDFNREFVDYLQKRLHEREAMLREIIDEWDNGLKWELMVKAIEKAKEILK
jgi:predicted  nucleic acid-binding Zn-ribbon protein